tara:strand:+ start:521 stop:907 length:387 start_codon:yes stop_codon:yes gene_type:complete
MRYWIQLIEQLKEYEGHVFAQKYRTLREVMINTIGIHRYASGMCEVCGKLIQIDILKDGMNMRDTSLERRSLEDLRLILEEVLMYRQSYIELTIMADWSLYCEESHVDRSTIAEIITKEDPPIDGIPF